MPLVAETAASTSSRVLLVDQHGHAPFKSIAEAVKQAKPGDTIRLAPGSGPYREVLFIKQSGEPGKPITFDGSGETVTGFQPLQFKQIDGMWICDLKPYFDSFKSVQGFRKVDGRWVTREKRALPAVISFQGTRLLQDYETGQFTDYATLSPDGYRITLNEGVSPEGWEISSSYFVVRINNVSHHVYKNMTASGSSNDGFNLHGTGSNLVFENVTACLNLDEGFSAHDDIECEIYDSAFFMNDTGIGNVANSVMHATNIRTYDNLGWGVWISNCTATLEGVRSWGNGVANYYFQGNAVVDMADVVSVRSPWTRKPWISSQESSSYENYTPYRKSPNAQVEGEVTLEDPH